MTDWSSRPRAIRLTAVIGALGLVLGAVGGALLLLGSGSDAAGDRKQVLARASDFAVTYNTYDVADVTDYQKRLDDLLSPGYKKQFVQVTDAVFKAIKDKEQKSGDAKVLATAINSIDEDSAEVLVAVDSTISNTDNKAAVQRNFRWTVSFVKSKGTWLVSNFESVAAVDAETTAPEAPSPSPSASPEGDSQ